MVFHYNDEREFNLIKESFDTKLFILAYIGKMFIPFPIDFNNKLIQFFQKEKKNKEIYEVSGCYGQQTPLSFVLMLRCQTILIFWELRHKLT